MEHTKALIIGAGVTGLSCAQRLQGQCILVEKSERAGGLCKTDVVRGFTFDHVIHLIHLRNDAVKKEVQRLLGQNKRFFEREAYVFLQGKMGQYPIQVYVDAFSPKVQRECFEGLVWAHEKKEKTPRNYAEWLLSRFGKGLCKYFFFPYNEKQWCRPLSSLVSMGTTRFVPKASLEEFIRGTFLGEKVVVGYNPRFFYPLRGGIEALPQKMASKIPNVRYNEELVSIDLEKKLAILNNGRHVSFDWLVSSMPLPQLLDRIKPLPRRIKKAAKKLKWVSAVNFNLGVRGTAPPGQWIYFPEKKFVFSRISVGSRLSPVMAPKGHFSLWIETFFDPAHPPDAAQLERKILNQLVKIRFIRKKKNVVAKKQVVIPFAYVVHNAAYEKSIRTILSFLKKNHILVGGRFGEWKYSSIEDSILDGWKLADDILKGEKA